MKGLTPVETPVTLRFASGLMRARHTRLALAMAVVMVALALLLPLAVLAGESDAPMTDQLTALFAEMLSDTDGQLGFWGTVLLVPLVAVFLAGQRRADLRLDSHGIECHMPRWLGLGLVGHTTGHWRVGWDDVQGVRLEEPKRTRPHVQTLGAYRLVLTTPAGEYRLSPFQRFDPQRDHRLGFGETIRPRKLDWDVVVRRAPLFDVVDPDGADTRGAAVRRSGPR
ncbi:MAG: hypothetical protein U5L11_17150 [Arhodomonas sp.]|nr:hypothetical protein [Arhodomonas sp.]